jgi:hypothetical protein
MRLEDWAVISEAPDSGEERTRKVSSDVANSQYGVTGADAPTVG